jgi:CHAT domain-containing protein/Tfp pilus assembly protein PilF
MTEYGGHSIRRTQPNKTRSLLVVLSAFALMLPMLNVRAGARSLKPAKAATPIGAQVPSLEPTKPVERELGPAEKHSYTIALSAGQHLMVIVDGLTIGLTVTLIAANGNKTEASAQAAASLKIDPLELVAEDSGIYFVDVQAQAGATHRGRYRLSVQLRAATQQDSSRIAARRLFLEARQLEKGGTADSMRAAIAKFEAAIPLWREAGDQRGEAETITMTGMAYHNLGQPKKGLEYYNRALPMWQSLGDKFWEARTLSAMGWSLQSHGENQTALDYYRKALEIRKAIGDRNGQAQTHATIATIHSSYGDLAKALDHYSQALSVIGESGDRLVRAYILNSVADAYDNVDEVQTALDYVNQALPLWKAAGNPLGEAEALAILGHIYGHLSQTKTALGYYEQAISRYQAAGNRYGEGLVLNDMGVAYWAVSEYQKALKCYDRALAIWQAMANRDQQSRVLGNIGLIYLSLGEHPKALDYMSRALEIREELGNRTEDAASLSNIGLVYLGMGELSKARDHFDRALKLYRGLENRSGEAYLLVYLSRVELNAGNLSPAREHLENALKILEPLRGRILSPELRATYFAAAYHGKYEVYIDILMRLHKLRPHEGYDGAALEASERARARTLLEMLTEAGADIRQGIDPELLERERLLQRQMDAKAEYQVRLLRSTHTEAEEAAVRKEIDALTSQYHEVEAQIRARSPRYAALTQPLPLNLKEIQQQVVDSDTLLLEYSLGTKRSYLWAVSPDSLTSYELPSRAEIETAARRVYGLLTARQPQKGDTDVKYRARVAAADAEFSIAAASLSQTLLGPAASRLGRKRLLIVADGALQYVPFAALPAPPTNHQSSVRADKSTSNQRLRSNPHSLIDGHEVVGVPSASALALLRRETAGRKTPAKSVAVLADPVFGRDDDRVKPEGQGPVDGHNVGKASLDGRTSPSARLHQAATDVGLTGEHIPRLPFSRQEAEAILAVAPPESSMKALGFAASRATATSSELRQYRIVHFATHGLLNTEYPELSGLVLSLVDEHGQPEDGFLRLHDLYNLNLPVDLVVLSACQTALGKEIRGEGLVGLTRGFMYAGAPRVAASLWKVDDLATAELMKHFYRGMLKDSQPPAAALRAAQLAMLKTRQWRAPFYWAPFVLQGEWR